MDFLILRGTADFFGLNHYTSNIVEPVPKQNDTPWYRDRGVIASFDPSWPNSASEWLKVVPRGFGDTLRKLKLEYGNPPIFVLENGFSDRGTHLIDTPRIEYLHDYLREMLIAVNRDGCNVKGYTVWSLMDNFEWDRGFK